MRRLQLDEPAALQRLKKLASHQNRKLTEIAQEVVDCEQIFYRLENV